MCYFLKITQQFITFLIFKPSLMQQSAIQLFRKRFTISQQSLAALLGINLGQLAMAETGKRPLPKKTAEKLRQLDQISIDGMLLKTMPQTEAGYCSFYLARQQELKISLQYFVTGCILKIYRLQKQLDKLQQKEEKALDTVSMLCAKSAAMASSKTEKHDAVWIAGQLLIAKDSLRSIPPGTIEILQMKINALDIQVTEANKQCRKLEIEAELYNGNLNDEQANEQLKELEEEQAK
jgi:transcriptional regulator with XRE-family HTH domain